MQPVILAPEQQHSQQLKSSTIVSASAGDGQPHSFTYSRGIHEFSINITSTRETSYGPNVDVRSQRPHDMPLASRSIQTEHLTQHCSRSSFPSCHQPPVAVAARPYRPRSECPSNLQSLPFPPSSTWTSWHRAHCKTTPTSWHRAQCDANLSLPSSCPGPY